MKILHVDTERGWRGGEQQLLYLVKGLIERGVECAVACRVNEELFKRCKREGIEVIPLKGNQSSDLFRIGYVGKKFDVIHAHSAKAHTISALSKRFHRKKVVYTRRVDYPPKKNGLTRLKYSLTDKIAAVSRKVADVITEELRIPKEKVCVIHSVTSDEIESSVNGRVVEEFRSRFKGKKIVGTVAALTRQKNIPNLIEAAKKVVEELPDTVFVLFGEGELEGELRELVKKEGLSENFLFMGFKENIQDYIKAFDLFVLPSDNEGFPGSLLHAMLLKVPVVSTDAGGVREVLKNFKTGIVVERGNPEELSKSIVRVLRDENLRKSLSEEGYRLVKSRFTVPSMVNSYLELYGEVLGGGKNV